MAGKGSVQCCCYGLMFCLLAEPGAWISLAETSAEPPRTLSLPGTSTSSPRASCLQGGQGQPGHQGSPLRGGWHRPRVERKREKWAKRRKVKARESTYQEFTDSSWGGAEGGAGGVGITEATPLTSIRGRGGASLPPPRRVPPRGLLPWELLSWQRACSHADAGNEAGRQGGAGPGCPSLGPGRRAPQATGSPGLNHSCSQGLLPPAWGEG
jgi:hypothetical protein